MVTDTALVAHEEFVELYLTDSITSKVLVAVIKDTPLRMNLQVEHVMMKLALCQVQRRELQKGYVMKSLMPLLSTVMGMHLTLQ